MMKHYVQLLDSRWSLFYPTVPRVVDGANSAVSNFLRGTHTSPYPCELADQGLAISCCTSYLSLSEGPSD